MDKIKTVMGEFKSGKLHSSSGQKVSNPKQAVAIALSEARKAGQRNEGGAVKESKQMMKKEIAFMKKKGAPKSMIKHEMAEAKYAGGGKVRSGGIRAHGEHNIQTKGHTKGRMLAKGGKVC